MNKSTLKLNEFFSLAVLLYIAISGLMIVIDSFKNEHVINMIFGVSSIGFFIAQSKLHKLIKKANSIPKCDELE